MLDERLSKELRYAIDRYDFPAVIFDFQYDWEVWMGPMSDVERYIRLQLISKDLDEVRDGLSNVLFWGFYRVGFRDYRVQVFRQGVTLDQLQQASDLFGSPWRCDLRAIKSLGLPQFSMMPFVSKIRMFLDPSRYVILDNKLLKIRTSATSTLFHDIKKGAKERTIRITQHNEACYDRWCAFCRRIAGDNFASEDYRAVEVERGVWQLVSDEHIDSAAEILATG